MTPNRLATERSPYLRMHGEDPVDWRTWGTQSRDEARGSGKPLLVSSGYASCHWCHVMQRESFRDPGTAAFMNEHFIPVKVDRELRPDVDKVFIDYVTASQGHAGWPLTVFTSPDLLPFFGGTYFPPKPVGDMPSFREILEAVAEAWESERADVADALVQVREFLDRSVPTPSSEVPADDVLAFATGAMLAGWDQMHGGFGGAPKFPHGPAVRFLAMRHAAAPSPRIVSAVDGTLTAMLRGGIFDQAGGGLCRYATDDEWLVPHFEKMLYDNAQLLSSLAAAAPLPRKDPGVYDEHAHAARATAGFMRRDLAAPGGGFFSALSADADGVEGATYVWDYGELAEILSPGELGLAESRLGVTPQGNWHRHSILVRPEGRAEDAEPVDALLEKLLAARAAHPQPGVDDKVLTGWNALAARGLVEAGRAFRDDLMAREGASLARWLLEQALREDGVARMADDPDDSIRLTEDAALLVSALLTVAETEGDEQLLARARAIHDDSVQRFTADGIVYMTEAEHDLPVRPVQIVDDTMPSPSSAMVENAVRLAGPFREPEYLRWAREVLRRHTPVMRAMPLLEGSALTAVTAMAAADKEATRRGRRG